MMRGVTVKPENMRAAVMQGFATATDLADYLVKKGMPFRDSHEVVALAVRHADRAGVDLSELPLEDLQSFSDLINEDVYNVLTPEGSLNARNRLGGTAPSKCAGKCALARPYRRLNAAKTKKYTFLYKHLSGRLKVFRRPFAYTQ